MAVLCLVLYAVFESSSQDERPRGEGSGFGQLGWVLLVVKAVLGGVGSKSKLDSKQA